MAGPRAIRLDLMRATNANISPIFAMFEDPEHRVQDLLTQISTTPHAFTATDDLGDIHRLWPIHDPAHIQLLTTSIHMSNITIADGHHRTTTALDYQREQAAAAGDAWSTDEAANYVLAGLIAVDDPGLVVLPAHRLISVPAPEDMVDGLSQFFDVTDLTAELPAGEDGARALLQRVRDLAGGPTAIGIIEASGRPLLATARSWETIEAAMPPHLSTASKHLDALVLTQLVLDPIFGIDPAALTAGAVVFTEDPVEAYEQTVHGPHTVAFLINGTPVRQIIEVADAGEVMPQKTTYFYPKLATGMVFNLLDDRSL